MKKGFFFGAFQFKSCATTVKLLGVLWIMELGLTGIFLTKEQ